MLFFLFISLLCSFGVKEQKLKKHLEKLARYCFPEMAIETFFMALSVLKEKG
jgi:hypothetical protein